MIGPLAGFLFFTAQYMRNAPTPSSMTPTTDTAQIFLEMT